MSKVIFITGSTDGIGKLAAIQLAQAGHQVYLHGRNAQKLEALIQEIKTLSGNDKINGWLADFADLKAVDMMAKQIKDTLPQLDVLINNAGVFKSPKLKNADGLELRYVVNYLAPYVLTKALLPLLQKGPTARIINLSSAAQIPVDYEVFKGKATASIQNAYAQSKLALTMWSFYLAQQLSNVSVIAVNPGSLLNTNMVKEGFGYHWSSAEKGANILYDLAVSTAYDGITGRYFDNDKGAEKGSFGKAHPDAYKADARAKLVQTTEQLLHQ